MNNEPIMKLTWIPVGEGMPEEQEELVALLRSGIHRFGRMIDGAFCDYCPETDRYVASNLPFGPKGITHWWPVPWSGGIIYATTDTTIKSGKQTQTVYCLRGCNQITTTENCGECAACGALMVPYSEEKYYDALERAGQCM